MFASLKYHPQSIRLEWLKDQTINIKVLNVWFVYAYIYWIFVLELTVSGVFNYPL